jgi:hypothetical protein
MSIYGIENPSQSGDHFQYGGVAVVSRVELISGTIDE